MKPRTKLQCRVADLSKNHIAQITDEQEKWAYRECLPHLAYASKTSAFCLDCGNTFSRDLIKRKNAICPHCKTKLEVNETQNRTLQKINYFAIAEIVGEFQVIRHFELNAKYKKGQKADLWIKPILEEWILLEGKTTLIGLKHSLNWNCDSWNGDWSIRINERTWRSDNKYGVYPRKYYPESAFKPEYLKYGINANLKGLTFFEAISIIPKEPKMETILKAGYYEVLDFVEDKRGFLSRFWPSIKIAIRNKYKIKDPSVWFDQLDLLRYFGKDLHNPKFVCPKNLIKEHKVLMLKKRVIEKKIQEEKDRQDAIKEAKRKIEMEQAFKDRIQQFLGLEFKSENIVVKVLKSVEEFEQEGDVLQHCVFTNEYFGKENSLILSARIENVPIETIEINLNKMKIEQSRGVSNQPSKYHNKIVSLVKRNLSQIKKANKKTA